MLADAYEIARLVRVAVDVGVAGGDRARGRVVRRLRASDRLHRHRVREHQRTERDRSQNSAAGHAEHLTALCWRPMRAMLAELRPPSVHRIPPARLVDRIDELRRLVRGRSVIDLGFVDEGQMGAKSGRGIWLHQAVAAAARSCIGIDADAEGVERARALGFDAYAADVEDPAALAALRVEPAE